MEGKLLAGFDFMEAFKSYGLDEEIAFDDMYIIMTKWATEQETLTYDDFAAAEESSKVAKMTDFKKMTDRVV